MKALRLPTATMKRLRNIAETEELPLEEVFASVVVMGLDCLDEFRRAEVALRKPRERE